MTLYECAGPTYVKSLCDSSNAVQVVLGFSGAKSGTFKDAVITLVTGDITKKATCGLAESSPCSIVASDGFGDSNSAPLAFKVPEITVKETDSVVGNSSHPVKVKGFPIGDTVVAQECDRTVRVPNTVATHCDPATQITGTAGARGRVTFTPSQLKILVGTAYADAAGRSCSFGRVCAIAVTDSTNAAFDSKVAITTAAPSAKVAKATNVRAGQVDQVKADGFPVGDTVVAVQCERSVKVPDTTAADCDPSTQVSGLASGNGKVAFAPGRRTGPGRTGLFGTPPGASALPVGALRHRHHRFEQPDHRPQAQDPSRLLGGLPPGAERPAHLGTRGDCLIGDPRDRHGG